MNNRKYKQNSLIVLSPSHSCANRNFWY